ncbi:MAG: putative capsid protein [Strenuusivirus resnapis]|uniref:Putative capsid protein n=1 Tax=Circoviridae sp. TaxID=1954248 RepID=A0A345MYT3_9VIRU|nr:MAG: putative capsid protein [Circoviridae sp.]
MPPITRGNRKPAGYWKGSTTTRRKPRRVARKNAPRRYKKAMTKSNKSSLFSISTYVPKVSYIKLRYNQTYILDGSYGAEYYQLAIAMNDPQSPSMVQFRGTAPSHAHTNLTANFSNDLVPLFQQYDHGVVTSSTCKALIRPASGNYRSAIYPATAGAGTEANPHYTNWLDADYHAENVCWSANVDSLSGIATAPDIHTLRDDTPGVQQKRLTTYPNDTRGISFTNNYTPQRALGIKDVGDNQARIGFTNGGTVPEKYFTQIGVQPLFTNAEHPTGTSSRMANMIITLQLDYVMKFTERKSVNNISRPTDHSTEL